jgi:hypothetical protein
MSKPALEPTKPPIQGVLGASCRGVKRPGRETDYSLSSSAEVKEYMELYIRPQYVFMVWCLVKHRDNFTFTLPHSKVTGLRLHYRWNSVYWKGRICHRYSLQCPVLKSLALLKCLCQGSKLKRNMAEKRNTKIYKLICRYGTNVTRPNVDPFYYNWDHQLERESNSKWCHLLWARCSGRARSGHFAKLADPWNASSLIPGESAKLTTSCSSGMLNSALSQNDRIKVVHEGNH